MSEVETKEASRMSSSLIERGGDEGGVGTQEMSMNGECRTWAEATEASAP